MPNQNALNANELGNVDGSAIDNASTSAPATDVVQASSDMQIAAKFTGTYIEGCDWVNRTDSSDGWQVVTYAVNLEMMSTEINYYTDPQCIEPNSPASMLTESSLVYPGGVHNTPFGFSDFVNITHETVMIDNEPASQQVVQQLAADGYFNTRYDSLNGGAILYFGDTEGNLDGTAPELRPNSLGTLNTPNGIYDAIVVEQVSGANTSVGVDTAASYNGTYLEDCSLVDEMDTSEGWSTGRYVFDGNALTMSIDYFTDAGCTQSSDNPDITFNAFIRYPGGQVLTPLGNADFVNITGLSLALDGQPLSRDVERVAAEEGMFETFFDLLFLDAGVLYFGDDSVALDASTPQRRPVELDFVATALAQ